MDHRREKASTFFTRLTHGLTRKQCSAAVPMSNSLGSPAPQTSLIFELPNELIHSILSHISPDPQLTGHHARFRIQYDMRINDHREQRVRFLRPLSMTCKAMRLRLLSWIWEHLEPSWSDFVGNLNTIVNASCADISLATNVKFMMVDTLWNVSRFPLFIKCLESLPSLHTLEIRWAEDYITTSLKDALKHSKLPQIKALILPPCAHPLLHHCHSVEDVDCVIKDKPVDFDQFLGFLASIRCSKVRRLAIPLVLGSKAFRYVAACPRLTELTILYPHPDGTKSKTAPSAMLELVNACKALPDFDTIQIVHFLPGTGDRLEAIGILSTEPLNRTLREEVKGVRDSVVDCLNKLEMGRQKGGRRKITLRVIELSPDHPRPHLGSVEVEECEV